MTTKTAEAHEGCKHCQPSNPPKQFAANRQTAEGFRRRPSKPPRHSPHDRQNRRRDNCQNRRHRLLVVGVHDWQGTELSNELRPADPKMTMLPAGVEVAARWAGNARKLRKKGHRMGPKSGSVDPGRSPTAPGIGCSLKRFQVVDSEKAIAQSKRRTWHVCLDEGCAGGCFIFYAFHSLKLRGAMMPHPMHRVTNNMKLASNASNLNVL